MDYQMIADLVMSKLVSTHEGGGENDHLTLDTWEWPQGVAVYAMMKVYKKTGNAAILEEIRDWYLRHLEKGLPTRNINTTAPMLTMAETSSRLTEAVLSLGVTTRVMNSESHTSG